MKKISIIVLAAFSFTFVSCKNDGKNVEPEVVTVDHDADKNEVYAVAQNTATFKDAEVKTLFEQYLQVQNALINSNAEDASKESAKLLEEIKNSGKSDEEIEEVVSVMAQTDDIKLQRTNFETLNDWMENLVKNEVESGVIYKQYCPMAFNDQGAYWLSTSKDVLNPYFGDVMLNCGRVDSEIQ